MEILKEIKGYEGKYSVSSWGRVISHRTNSPLSEEETEKGYLRVSLIDSKGKRKHFKVHRLVADAFIDNPYRKKQVNHKDGNRHNNSVTNLEWNTDLENKTHQKKMNNGSILSEWT